MSARGCELTLVVGSCDEPTDGVRDYCARLATALQPHGATAQVWEVPWQAQGVPRALNELRVQRRAWTGRCVLLQHTHGMWPWRGFPLGFLALVGLLKRRGAQVAVVFHDPLPWPGGRPVDRARRLTQLLTMRLASASADLVMSTVDPDRVPWMRHPVVQRKAHLIPVGSNVPERLDEPRPCIAGPPTVAVFGVTEHNPDEARLLAGVARRVSARIGPTRLLVLGRGSDLAKPVLLEELTGSDVLLEVCGLLPPEEVSARLATAHVQLFVRGGVSSRRTSAIAGIACGLPVVGYSSEETAFPITEAGVRLVPLGDSEGLARELAAVLADEGLRRSLSERSREAARSHFSWDVIARQYLDLLWPGERAGAASR